MLQFSFASKVKYKKTLFQRPYGISRHFEVWKETSWQLDEVANVINLTFLEKFRCKLSSGWLKDTLWAEAWHIEPPNQVVVCYDGR